MRNKKKLFTLEYAKKFLNKKGLELFKKNNQIKSNNSFKSLSYTVLSGLILIIIFFSSPLIINFKNNLIIQSTEITNSSKNKLERVLTGKTIENEQNDELDILQVFEDIFQHEDISTSSVRLSASTIEQLFKDTKYNLKDVRKSKLVKPINLELLPNEMKMIENTKRRKNLFIQIILPLILEENNRIKLDRKKLFSILNRSNNSNLEKKWLDKKFKQYGVVNKDVSTLKVRMDIVPVSLAIAQAAKETGWGTSRFALEGNALFGQWTWSGEGIKPAGADDNTTHKVMRFKILKSSVRAYQRNLNTHPSYKQFRMARAELRDNKKNLNSLILANYLDKYAETGKEYIEILKKIINQNNLTDFDDVKLLPSSLQLKSLI